ncbi:MAG: UPF0147 family protein [Candidatus Aenigmarchaeota archaeon]|nr:UPF0147 family protein [Candidatus Aenigmarchaeota archaeon]
MEREDIVDLVKGILTDGGVPRRIKEELEQSLLTLNASVDANARVSSILSILDEASNNPNLSLGARTHIWNIVSTLEGEMIHHK